jgi:hypothetical protein
VVLTDVTEKNDLLPYRAHHAGHHRTAMELGPYRDGRAEFARVIGRVSSQLVDGGETGRDAAVVRGPLFELPGRDQLIANVAMDFSARRYNRLGEIEVETIEQAMKGERTQPLGQSRRALHVEEQEHSRFRAGA